MISREARLWDYDIAFLTGTHDALRELLRARGREGWRLVAVQGNVGYFERPLPEETR